MVEHTIAVRAAEHRWHAGDHEFCGGTKGSGPGHLIGVFEEFCFHTRELAESHRHALHQLGMVPASLLLYALDQGKNQGVFMHWSSWNVIP